MSEQTHVSRRPCWWNINTKHILAFGMMCKVSTEFAVQSRYAAAVLVADSFDSVYKSSTINSWVTCQLDTTVVEFHRPQHLIQQFGDQLDQWSTTSTSLSILLIRGFDFSNLYLLIYIYVLRWYWIEHVYFTDSIRGQRHLLQLGGDEFGKLANLSIGGNCLLPRPQLPGQFCQVFLIPG